jgi:hypothetical protein
MPRLSLLAFISAAIIAASSHAHADPLDRNGLLRVLSMLTGGWVDPTDPAVVVTSDGDQATVRVPIAGIATTADATLHHASSNVWDLLSVALPDTLSAPSGPDHAGQTIIGKQETHGRLDPTLTTPSELHATLHDVAFTQIHGETHSVSAAATMTTESHLTASDASHVDIHGNTISTGYTLVIRNPKGTVLDAKTARVHAQATASGVNPTQFPAFAKALHEVRTGSIDPPLSAAQLLETVTAAAQRISGQEDIDGASFTLGDKTPGKIGPSHLSADFTANNDRLTVSTGMAIDGLDIGAVAPNGLKDLVPHHIVLRERASDVPIKGLVTLLHHAGAPDADRNAVRQEALQYIANSGAVFTIDALDFDAGPLRFHGTGRLFTPPDGQVGVQLHLRATGLDALLAQSQTNPSLRQITPALFMAKGMGRPDGDALVWDVAVNHGALTVNGIPLGHPPGIPGAPPPSR